MLKIMRYQCEGCKREYKDPLEAERCEAGHYGLTLDEYNEWMTLCKRSLRASYRVGAWKCPETDRELDEAIEAKLNFEAAHGLESVMKPTSFYR